MYKYLLRILNVSHVILILCVLLLLLSRFSRVWLCATPYGSPLGSSVPGIFQVRVLERVAISFSSAWKGKVKVKSLSRARLLETPWTIAYQAPLSMGFSKQEYWSGVPLPSLWLCWISLKRDGNTRPPYLPPEKPVCRSKGTVRPGHETKDWFQIGKAVHQGCILSPC